MKADILDAIRELQVIVHETAVRKGWWDTPMTADTTPAKLALIHSEVSEALEEYRNGRMGRWYSGEDHKPEGIDVELADAVIRILDLCGALGLDLAEAIKTKHEFNLSRSHKHGGKVV